MTVLRSYDVQVPEHCNIAIAPEDKRRGRVGEGQNFLPIASSLITTSGEFDRAGSYPTRGRVLNRTGGLLTLTSLVASLSNLALGS